jgi:hypothetical protein
MFSMFFFISLYVQEILHYSPVRSGVSFLPVTLVIGLTATVTSRYVARLGYKIFMVIAPIFIAIGLFMLSHIAVGGTYMKDVLPGVSILSFGVGMSFVAISIAATSGVHQRESGLASGLLNTAQQIGGALGLAILSGVSASKAKNVLEAAGARAHQPLVMAQATVSGFHSALLVGTGFALVASLVSLVVIKQRKGESLDSEAIGPELEHDLASM